MPWIGKSVTSVRANSLSTADSLSSWTTIPQGSDMSGRRD